MVELLRPNLITLKQLTLNIKELTLQLQAISNSKSPHLNFIFLFQSIQCEPRNTLQTSALFSLESESKRGNVFRLLFRLVWTVWLVSDMLFTCSSKFKGSVTLKFQSWFQSQSVNIKWLSYPIYLWREE